MKVNKCPKCGREPQYHTLLFSGLYEVKCPHCKINSGLFKTPQKAVQEWNKLTDKEGEVKCG